MFRIFTKAQCYRFNCEDLIVLVVRRIIITIVPGTRIQHGFDENPIDTSALYYLGNVSEMFPVALNSSTEEQKIEKRRRRIFFTYFTLARSPKSFFSPFWSSKCSRIIENHHKNRSKIPKFSPAYRPEIVTNKGGGGGVWRIAVFGGVGAALRLTRHGA